jgi:hypothetical protein
MQEPPQARGDALSAEDLHDIAIINANAERLNAEAEENLLFQDIPGDNE